MNIHHAAMEPFVRSENTANAGLFRASKRRKTYRKRLDAEDEVPVPATAIPASDPLTVVEPLPPDAMDGYNQVRVEGTFPTVTAELLRRRMLAQRRRGGIEFTNLYASISKDSDLEISTSPSQDGANPAEIKQVIERFAPQTGQISEATDKHMMAYIESELAKRDCQDQEALLYKSKGQTLSSDGALLNSGTSRQPAALGKLHEIDLGPDSTLRNIQRTEAAQRKLEGAEPDLDAAPGKIRLKRNGRPWGYRKRRNSEDVKRDKLVEEVMRESKLEIYDEPDAEPVNDDQAADDRIAEQFRREFMDAMSSRRHKRSAQAAKPVKGKAVDEVSKGPKLGGSRSARAAMREKELAAKKK